MLQVLCSSVRGHHQDNRQGRGGPRGDDASEDVHRQNSHHASLNLLPAEQSDRSRFDRIE